MFRVPMKIITGKRKYHTHSSFQGNYSGFGGGNGGGGGPGAAASIVFLVGIYLSQKRK